MLTVALCVIGHDRPEELQQSLASASGQPFDEVLVIDMASTPPLEPMNGTRWTRLDVNEGPVAGRNRLIEMARSDVLVFLDDDAILAVRDTVDVLGRAFRDDPRLAAVAFRVRRQDGSERSDEFPFRGGVRHPERARECAYFLGAGHAIRRSAAVSVGGYDASFFYSTEEVDLGFRLLEDGWHMRYEPSLVVEHRPSMHGRGVMPRVPALRLRNRIILARRHLPLPVAAIHIAAWSVRTAREAQRSKSLRAWCGAWREGFSAEVTRGPLSLSQLLHIHRIGGRVLW